MIINIVIDNSFGRGYNNIKLEITNVKINLINTKYKLKLRRDILW